MNPQMIKMVVTNTVHQVDITVTAPKNKPPTPKMSPFLQKGHFSQNPFSQDYSNCHESITEKLVVIDVSDVIGEAIRYLVSGIWYCVVMYLVFGIVL